MPPNDLAAQLIFELTEKAFRSPSKTNDPLACIKTVINDKSMEIEDIYEFFLEGEKNVGHSQGRHIHLLSIPPCLGEAASVSHMFRFGDDNGSIQETLREEHRINCLTVSFARSGDGNGFLPDRNTIVVKDLPWHDTDSDPQVVNEARQRFISASPLIPF